MWRPLTLAWRRRRLAASVAFERTATLELTQDVSTNPSVDRRWPYVVPVRPGRPLEPPARPAGGRRGGNGNGSVDPGRTSATRRDSARSDHTRGWIRLGHSALPRVPKVCRPRPDSGRPNDR